MTEAERQSILQMVEQGKISAAEALTLMKALELAGEDSDNPEESMLIEDGAVDGVISFGGESQGGQTAPGSTQAEDADDPEVQRLMAKARSLWPLAIGAGVLLTVAGAYGLYGAYSAHGAGFWFVLAMLPLLLGVAVLVLAAENRGKRWLYIDVQQREKQGPQRIILALPASVVAAILGIAGGYAPGKAGMAIDELRQALRSESSTTKPILLKVDDGDGERVTIFLA